MSALEKLVADLREYTTMLKEDCARAAYMPPGHVPLCDQAATILAQLLDPPEALVEKMARAIDPKAFMTLRNIAAEKGLDAANPPVGVILSDPIDEPLSNRHDARETARSKAKAVLAFAAHLGAGM